MDGHTTHNQGPLPNTSRETLRLHLERTLIIAILPLLIDWNRTPEYLIARHLIVPQ